MLMKNSIANFNKRCLVGNAVDYSILFGNIGESYPYTELNIITKRSGITINQDGNISILNNNQIWFENILNRLTVIKTTDDFTTRFYYMSGHEFILEVNKDNFESNGDIYISLSPMITDYLYEKDGMILDSIKEFVKPIIENKLGINAASITGYGRAIAESLERKLKKEGTIVSTVSQSS